MRFARPGQRIRRDRASRVLFRREETAAEVGTAGAELVVDVRRGASVADGVETVVLTAGLVGGEEGVLAPTRADGSEESARDQGGSCPCPARPGSGRTRSVRLQVRTPPEQCRGREHRVPQNAVYRPGDPSGTLVERERRESRSTGDVWVGSDARHPSIPEEFCGSSWFSAITARIWAILNPLFRGDASGRRDTG